MTEAVGYMRCSGEAFMGETWSRQEEAINRYAQANDIHIVEWFRDEGVPGKTEMRNRAGLAACMARVADNCIKLVLVESSDRLARDSMVSELIIREFQKSGVQVISASGGVNLTAGDDSNPTAKLVRQILAAVAEFDRCVIVLKLRAARERLRQANGKCEGRTAYGHDSERPEEKPTLERIVALSNFGRFQPRQIAGILNEEGIPTRYGKRWHGATISKILSRHENCVRIAPDSVQV
jgi:DNA invertase Pin-like site-specific DNA recombinase